MVSRNDSGLLNDCEPVLSSFDSRRNSLQDSGTCLRRTLMSGEDIMSMRRESSSHLDLGALQQRPNLSFSGCGFNGIYHVGVCAALQDFAPHLYEDNMISGTSAGSIAAACLMCNLSMRKCTETIIDVISTCKKEGMLFSSFNLNTYLRSTMEKILPDNAHEICNGKLNISLTKVNTSGPIYSLENHVVSTYETKDELITAIMCSSFIPMVSGLYFPEFKGMNVMDGGFSNNMIEMNDATITVTPFVAEADICPIESNSHQCFFDLYNTKLKFNFFNFERFANLVFPGSADRMVKLLRLGFDDCIRYLLLRKFIFCNDHAEEFTKTGRNNSDTCSDCQELVKRAGSSSVPSYLEEMIYEKEPSTYSYWGSVLDNRFASTLFQLTDACSSISDIQFNDMCRSMDIMRHLKMNPFINILAKPIEWYFWIFKTIWNLINGRKSKREIKYPTQAVKSPKKQSNTARLQRRSNSLISTSCPLENIHENTPTFFIPDEQLPRNVCDNTERIETYINSAVEAWNYPNLRDSGIGTDESLETSIIELINYEKSPSNDVFHNCVKNLNDNSVSCVDTISNCDSDLALSVDG